MKNTIRIISLLLALVLCIGCFASCKTNPDNGNNSVDELPQSDNYVANVQIRFATNDEKMKAAVDAMTSNATINVYGDNFNVYTTSKVNDNTSTNSYTLVDEILYYSSSLSLGEHTVSENKKAEFTATDKEQVISDLASTAKIDIGDFYVVDMTKNGNKTSYVCSDAFDEAKAEVASVVADRFAAIGATVAVSGIEYHLETESERNVSSILSCDYIITLDGVNYEITMRLYTTYNYDATVEVSAPENADSYVSVPYSEIVK